MEDCMVWSPDDVYLYLQEPYADNHFGVEWTYHEDKMFECTLAEEGDIESPAFYVKILTRLPRKTFDQVRWHYEMLKADVAMIEHGEIPLPEYKEVCNSNDMAMSAKGGISLRRQTSVVKRKRGVPWTDEEHRLFLKGLEKCGKGDWRNISRLHVPSKTPAQVASHAQKYFRRIDSSTPVQKRRYSIHDTRIINSTIIVMAARCNELSVVQEELGPMSGNFNRMPATSFLGYHNSINQGQYTQRSFSTPLIDAGSPQPATAIGRLNMGYNFC
ncbi:hypothetical protein Droror1_Dr00005222 [Drosera rotundifolia]